MTPNILVKDLASQADKTVRLQGWVVSHRSSGKIAFIQFRDGTGTVQLVLIKSQIPAPAWSILPSLTLESSIWATGVVHADPRAPTGYEIQVKDFNLLHLANSDYPIGKKNHGPAFLLDHRHLWLRSPKQRAILIVRAKIVQTLRAFFEANTFTEIATPIFTPNACEGTTTLFSVDYFGRSAFLSQSGQLYLESLLPTFNRVYDLQPVFRAEKSKTRRHLVEFWMANAEMAFFDHQANLNFQERLIRHLIQTVSDSCVSELSLLGRDLKVLLKSDSVFERLTHHDVVKLLQKHGSSITFDSDLGAEDETLLGDIIGRPVFVEFYPAQVKAFYMKRLESDPTLAKCADLIAPEGHGEIIGGSEREADLATLTQSLKSHSLPLNEFSWYLDLRRYGSVPHSGFGIGIERLVKWFCHLPHVRETIAYPRLLHRLNP